MENCECCHDTGILLMTEGLDTRVRVERCDICEKYPSDEEAVKALDRLLYGTK